MKRIIFIFFLTGLTFIQAQGQLPGGFFSQQAHKKQLMLAQIAAYQLYLEQIKSGYHIAQSGLNTARALKSGTFSLHAAYFNSLQQVSPVVKSDTKAKDIPRMAQQIAANFELEIAFQQKLQTLEKAEQDYLRNVYQGIVQKCRNDLSDLNQVLTPGKLELTDQQRLERIGHIYLAMADKLAFSGAFTAKCHRLALARQQSSKDRQILKSLYGGN